MPALTPQQSDWESNGYVVATTRVFILAGVVQLGRSLYHLISRYSGVVAETAPTTGASLLYFLCPVTPENSPLKPPAIL